MMTGETVALAAEIDRAWADAAYPGDDAISAGWDNEGELAREMVGKHWRDLGLEFLQRFTWGDGVDQLRPAAFGYYVPAFLKLALTSDSTQAAMVRLLTPPLREHRATWSWDRFWDHVDRLDEDQKRVFAKLLVYWRARQWLSEAEWNNALEYWQPYLPTAEPR